MPPEYFQWLGIESPPDKGEYFVSWRHYMKEQLKDVDIVERDEILDRGLTISYRPWTAKDDPELADWLKQNERPLAVLLEATKRTEYYNPLVPRRTEDWSPGLICSLLPNAGRCRECAFALICRAMLRVADGKIDDAWQDLLASHRLGRLIARGGTLIEMLIGIAIDGITGDREVVFLDHAELTSAQVLACRQDVRNLPPMPAVADKIDLAERFMFLDIMMLTAHHGRVFLENIKEDSRPPKGNKFTSRLFTPGVNWDPALRNANRWFDRLAAGLRITDRHERLGELAAITQELTSLRHQHSIAGAFEKSFMTSDRRGEMIGNAMIGSMIPAFGKLQDAAERCEQWQRNLHVAFALTAYQRDHRQYPAQLEELAPKYLEKIPDDLFSGKPLIYRQEDHGFLLYSVGLNGIDDDGRTYGEEPSGDDIRVRMPVPPPRAKD
jgi:hypothetical protein